jgi:tetratricopeptide (TPR) repeat protein
MEIEADEFSGFVLSKMGASLSQAQEAIALISSYADDTYSTHPSKDKRLAAIERGYNNGKSNSSGKVYRKNSQDLTAQDYFYKAYNSEDADYQLNCYTKCLSLDPEYGGAATYNNRGIAYKNLGRYQDAIRDYTRALSIDPDNASAYINRGFAYDELGRYQDAIRDCTRALSIDPDNAIAYNNRGFAYDELGRYQDAIRDYTRTLSIDPDYAIAYNNRGVSKGKLGIYNCDDYLKACQLGNQFGCDNYSNSCTD